VGDVLETQLTRTTYQINWHVPFLQNINKQAFSSCQSGRFKVDVIP